MVDSGRTKTTNELMTAAVRTKWKNAWASGSCGSVPLKTSFRHILTSEKRHQMNVALQKFAAFARLLSRMYSFSRVIHKLSTQYDVQMTLKFNDSLNIKLNIKTKHGWT